MLVYAMISVDLNW